MKRVKNENGGKDKGDRIMKMENRIHGRLKEDIDNRKQNDEEE